MSKITIFCICGNERTTTKGNINKTNKCVKCCKKINYDKLIEILNNVKVLTTKDEWNKTTMTKIEKIKIKCINDSCNEIRILSIKGIGNDTKMCKNCSNKKKSNIMINITTDDNNNTIKSGLVINSSFVSGSDKWENGIFYNSIWNVDSFTWSNSATGSNINSTGINKFKNGIVRESTWIYGTFENG